MNLFIINAFQLFNLAIIKRDKAKVVLNSLIVKYNKTTYRSLIAHEDKNNFAKLIPFYIKIQSPNTTIDIITKYVLLAHFSIIRAKFLGIHRNDGLFSPNFLDALIVINRI